MCGIAGILRNSGVDLEEDIRSMTDALAHRGPDGVGHEVRSHWALGHRRLSIIDLEGGAQPMCDVDQRCWITYNGEIYNYRELRAELESVGLRFRTHSDTEVVLQAYRRWGADAVLRLRGMFAFGIVDLDRQELFLARDPAGIKPLVYHRRPDGFVFASEIKALRAMEGGPQRIRASALQSCLRFGFIPGAESVFAGVGKLLPGHRMRVPLRGGDPRIESYWRWQPRPRRERLPTEELLEALDQSVRSHLVSDVPFGVFLSGGIDSSLVAWRMSEILAKPVRAYAIGFDDPTVDESQHAERVARELGLEIRLHILRPADFGRTAEILALYDEPFADGSAIPTWYVSALARAEVPMVLSGDGGDELFGGYERYDDWAERCRHHRVTLRHRLRRKPAKAVAQLMREGMDRLGGGWGRHHEYLEFFGQESEGVREELVRPEWRLDPGIADPGVRAAHRHARAYDDLQYARVWEAETYLPDDVLAKVDIASMAHGLEVRPPLLDRRMFDLAGSLRQAAFHDPKRPCGRRGKLPLRALLATRFPAEDSGRAKQGFGIPVRSGFRAGGFLDGMLRDLVGDPRHAAWSFFDPLAVERLSRRHNPPGEDHASLLWSVLAVALWLGRHPTCDMELA